MTKRGAARLAGEFIGRSGFVVNLSHRERAKRFVVGVRGKSGDLHPLGWGVDYEAAFACLAMRLAFGELSYEGLREVASRA